MRISMKLLALMIISVTVVAAQSISGTVKDSRTGEVLVGANVLVKGTFNGATTNTDGKFTINNVSGSVTLIVNYIGYKSKSVDGNAGDDLTIELAEELYGDQVVVTGSRIEESLLESPVTIEKLDAIDIKNAPTASFYEAMASMKSVDIVTASLGMKTVNLRGFNSTSPDRMVQFIDGMDNSAPALNFPVSNLVGMSELDIESAELIYGASSALYGANAFNGVVSLTSKSPWDYPGVSVRVTGGERNYLESILRYAGNANNKVAWKMNVSYTTADDWVSDNYYGSDAIKPLGLGFNEDDLYDPVAENLKLGGSFHFRPTNKMEISLMGNYGSGSTVYQGAQRYFIKNFSMYQTKLQIDGKTGDDSYTLKAYYTQDDAGDTYNIGLVAGLLLGAPAEVGGPVLSTDDPRFDAIFDDVISKPLGIGADGAGAKLIDKSSITHFEGLYNTSFGPVNAVLGASYRISDANSEGTLFRDAGTIFSDFDEGDISVGEVGVFSQFVTKFMDDRMKLTASFRYDKHENFDGQFSPGASLVFTAFKDEAKSNSGNIRLSYQTAFKNPTMQDQYIALNVGPANTLSASLAALPSSVSAVLWGNFDGFRRQNAVTVESFLAVTTPGSPVYTDVTALETSNIDPVKPEKVEMFEVGYKMTFGSFYVDMAYYTSNYTDFIQSKNFFVLRSDYDPSDAANTSRFLGDASTAQYDFYDVDSNTDEEVSSEGFDLNLAYNINENFDVNANYAYALLTGDDSTGAGFGFNTPKNKWNLGLSGRRLMGGKFGFRVNVKHVDGFQWNGSGFQGYVGAYEVVDIAFLYDFNVSNVGMTAKLLASNALNEEHAQAFGTPKIGRLMLFQLSADL